jgi:hypothetical protein
LGVPNDLEHSLAPRLNGDDEPVGRHVGFGG